MTKTEINRVFLIVLDSVGVGSLPDAAAYGDEGANTLGHIAERRGGLNLPHLAKLGLGNIIPIRGVAAVPRLRSASWGRMAEMARSKDTLAGHWEMMGIVLEQPFSLFPRRISRPTCSPNSSAGPGSAGILGNKAASGTEIIAELGAEHVRSGFPDRLHLGRQRLPDRRPRRHHPACPRSTRCACGPEQLCDDWRIGRVIARPFIGRPGRFPPHGQPPRFFHAAPRGNGPGRPAEERTAVTGDRQDREHFRRTGHRPVAAQPRQFRGHAPAAARNWRPRERGLIFANLVDFDMLYGHRNDVDGYAAALEDFRPGAGTLCCPDSDPATC